MGMFTLSEINKSSSNKNIDITSENFFNKGLIDKIISRNTIKKELSNLLELLTSKNKIPKKISLYETVLVSANDQLVDLFLKNKISFQKITFFLNKILIKKNFLKYRNRSPKNYNEIIKLSNYVRLKTILLCI